MLQFRSGGCGCNRGSRITLRSYLDEYTFVVTPNGARPDVFDKHFDVAISGISSISQTVLTGMYFIWINRSGWGFDINSVPIPTFFLIRPNGTIENISSVLSVRSITMPMALWPFTFETQAGRAWFGGKLITEPGCRFMASWQNCPPEIFFPAISASRDGGPNVFQAPEYNAFIDLQPCGSRP